MDRTEILHQSVQLQLNLQRSLKNEIHPSTVPVPWFGNLNSEETRIVTVAANPSRREFLKGTTDYIQKTINAGGLPELLPKSRLELLNEHQSLEDVLTSRDLSDRLIGGYNNYFSSTMNPYTQWFGNKNTPYGSKMEAFVNGFNASYYDESEFEHRAIHIDMIPVATYSDFSKIAASLPDETFKSAKVLIESLIKTINPSKVIIVGRKNIEYFSKYFWDLGSPNISWNGHKSSPHAHLTRMMDIPVIATSLYVPNPYGYGSEDLFNFAEFLSSIMNNA